jgi:hypothetical protein
MSRPRYTASAVVAAPTEEVWPALLASLKYVPAPAREKILRSTERQRLRVPLPEEDGGPSAGHVTVTADPARHTVTIKGAWWYQGGWTVEPHPGGSLVRYEVFNAAFLPTRWVVPIVARGLAPRLAQEFTGTLRRTTGRLGLTPPG